MNVWRDRLERWFRPLALHSPLSPNAITVLALVLNLSAAVSLALAGTHHGLFLIAPLIVAIAGVLDALDGIVARVRNEQSLYGDFLDHLFDRISDSSLLAGYLYATAVRPALGYPALIAVIMTGYVGTQIEATYRRRSYEGIGRGEYLLAMVSLLITTWILSTTGLLQRPFYGLTIPEWLVGLLLIMATWTVGSRTIRARTEDRSS